MIGPCKFPRHRRFARAFFIGKMNKEFEAHIGNKKLVIEAGHIQAKQTPGVEQTQGVGIAVDILSMTRNTAHKTVLIDDRKTLVKSGEITAYIRWLVDNGYKPDTVFLESELTKPALELLHELQEKYSWDFSTHVPTRGRRYRGEGIRTSAGTAPLLTSSGEPSVELMDAALYREKSLLGDIPVTILPEHYRGEQRKTMALLKKVGENIPVTNVFFKPGQEVVLFKANK